MGVGFDWVTKLALDLLNASDTAKNVLSQITLIYVLVIGIAGTLSSTSIVIHLTIRDMRNLFAEASKAQDGSDNYAE